MQLYGLYYTAANRDDMPKVNEHQEKIYKVYRDNKKEIYELAKKLLFSLEFGYKEDIYHNNEIIIAMHALKEALAYFERNLYRNYEDVPESGIDMLEAWYFIMSDYHESRWRGIQGRKDLRKFNECSKF